MQLIGAGLPRTGTLSQKVALEMLGVGPCYHMVNVLGDLSQADYWKRGIAGESPWDDVLAGFESTVDWPGGFFYKELMETYPDAKVLLSWRDPERWAKSMKETVWGFRHGESYMRLIASARGEIDPGWAGFLEMIDGLLWKGEGTFAGADGDSEKLIELAERHNEEVKAHVPSDRLLVFDVAEGWEPLCAFLDKPVPDQPFPNTNDSKTFVSRVVHGSVDKLTEWKAEQPPIG